MTNERAACESNVYHVTARGVGRQVIFETEPDFQSFMLTLGEQGRAASVDILAWCLMDK